jgi:hypothetical protein
MALGRLVVNGVRYGVKHGPHVKVIFDQVKEPATDYAKARLESQRGRRLAVAKARTLRDGTVLQVVHGDQPVWVVFSGDDAVSAHPDPGVPVADLLTRADLTRRRRPDELPSARQRAVTAKDRALGTVRRTKT